MSDSPISVWNIPICVCFLPKVVADFLSIYVSYCNVIFAFWQTKKRPSPDFVETTQKDIDTSMRAILIDWLVEVSIST
jgi:hypothetical protein